MFLARVALVRCTHTRGNWLDGALSKLSELPQTLLTPSSTPTSPVSLPSLLPHLFFGSRLSHPADAVTTNGPQ